MGLNDSSFVSSFHKIFSQNSIDLSITMVIMAKQFNFLFPQTRGHFSKSKIFVLMCS
uniref:Uncharacterized protein n=1 Tax=Anguilla anguilla TaxID=7936 RepID=A0A0E9TSI6_ANGAN